MAKEQYNRDQASERSPQYRHMVNLENKERRVREKKRDKRGGKKIGKTTSGKNPQSNKLFPQ